MLTWIMDSNLNPLEPLVLSVCPDCERPNFSKMNWCTACGCLLIGYDPPSQISTYSEFSQHQTRYGDVSYTTGCTYNENSNLGLCFPVQYPKLGTQPSHSSGEITGLPPNDCSQISLPLAYGDNGIQMAGSFSTSDSGHSRSFGRNQNFHGRNFQNVRELRQRCVSGPCGSGTSYSGEAFDPFFANSQSSSSIRSDLDYANRFPPDYAQVNALGPSVFVQGPYQAASYFQNFDPVLHQNVEEISMKLKDCITSDQVHARSLTECVPRENPGTGLLAPRILHVQQPNALRCASSEELQAGQSILLSGNFPRRRRRINAKQKAPRWGRSANRTNRGHSPTTTHTDDSNYADGSTGAIKKKESETVSTSTRLSPSNSCSDSQNKEEAMSSREKTVGNDEVAEFECSSDESSSPEARNWLSLPTELWFLIVSALDYAGRANLARTCRRLHTIVSDRHFWRSIRLDRYRHLTDAGLAAIGRKRPQELHLVYCRGDSVTTKGVRQLFCSCGKNLQRLSFIGCSKGAFQGDSILLISALYCKNLSHIDASYAHTVRDQTIRAVAEASVALKSVQLNGAQNISNSAIEHLVRYHKSTLERLELFGCFRLNSKIFTTLGECHGLKALAFGFLHHLSSAGLLELVSKLPLLASLDLRGTQKLVTDASLTRLATKCPFLEEIVLANMSSITKEDGVVTMLHGLPRLRVLDLCGLSVVGDDTLQALASSCPLLEELDVSCTSVTEKGLLHLANAPARNLRSLRISFCDHITKDSLANVVAACPRLTRIALYGFSWIDRWNFLFDVRPNLVIQAETQTLTAASVQANGEKVQS